ncbi:uncharacterized protein LOC115233134 isoform X2 [Formica exsecta]|uniref:uncharacterized protein LOC115233134 isoform X2 n=1 Tax=Formica exsecta TaxID=72781 RepID=UPI001145012D|nr:uncharacterized protein LOC115233134 isoform X2 [Formica exsecta]XP_029659261.1 uncharacterized protein LOC115233134 isoform X2 [Formica exsecta]
MTGQQYDTLMNGLTKDEATATTFYITSLVIYAVTNVFLRILMTGCCELGRNYSKSAAFMQGEAKLQSHPREDLVRTICRPGIVSLIKRISRRRETMATTATNGDDADHRELTSSGGECRT